MVTEYPGDVVFAPTFRGGNKTVNQELLYSTEAFTQSGVTLKAGQGVLLLGTLLARETSTKKYVRYNNAGSDGTNVVSGVLRQSVNTGSDANAPEKLGNKVIRGILKLERVVAANSSGAVTAAITALGARRDDIEGTFTF
jgi:hypothetical protein